MAKKRKKPRSRFEQWFFDWLDRQEEGGTFHRMASSSVVSMILQEEQPFWFWLIVAGMLIVLMLPMLAFWLAMELLGHGELIPRDNLFAIIGLFSSFFAGIGTINLYMIPVQKLCEWRLHKDFPKGIAPPFYLGHKVTLIFLLGFGGMATLCAFLIHVL